MHLFLRDGRRKTIAWVADLVTVAVLLLLWQHVDSGLALSVSRPGAVGRELGHWFTDSDLRHALVTTLENALVGFLLAVVIGTVLASLLASSRLSSIVLSPYLSAVNAVPKIALAPVFVLLFGTGGKGKVYFIALSVFFIPFYSLFRAITAVDPTSVNHAKVLGAPRFALVKDVYAPAVLGSLTATLRVTASFALISAVIFELVAGSGGIGYELSIAQQTVQANVIVSGVIIVAVVGFVVDRLLVLAERRFSTWRLA